jgi:hypothetical protein
LIGVGVVLLGAIILIPIVFRVLRTNRMVMALFGKIKIEDIQMLAQKCDDFITKVLTENMETEKEKRKRK